MNDTPEPIAWAVYGDKTGLLRYVVSDEENVRQLVDEGGYVARPLFEHPAPTPPADDAREASIASLTRLREVWAALGCAYNPNDFHISVQQTMWTQALAMIREATEQTSRVYRENQQLEEALRVSLAAFANDPPTRKHYATADAILADRALEVRPRGRGSDADWEEHLAGVIRRARVEVDGTEWTERNWRRQRDAVGGILAQSDALEGDRS